jgi:phosphatidylserine/phosphatidylglycerophosphate/cardiolipin synthase-like enzyme
MRHRSSIMHVSVKSLVLFTALLIIGASDSSSAIELKPCFTPGQDCTALIVQQIDGAKSELLVQAYGFTSPTIIQAIGRAKERGVDVKVILDKTNAQKRYTGATYLTNHGIPVLIDDTVAIAHNKAIVIDGRAVITGSFNFTQAAQTKNAENVLLIEDAPALAEAYAANWSRRATVSRPLEELRPSRKDMGAEPD